ncbi:MAG TPA: 3-keto-5-aminohexanoate cleavage protein [Rhodocyclaceae bacterium]
MQADQGIIINLACTGMTPTRESSRHVPLSHDEIVDNVARAMESGVQMFHLHARDDQEQHTGDPESYGRIIESIRKLPGGRLAVLTVTTSGRSTPDFASRARVLDLDGDMKPDMASLTLSSLNFLSGASVNSPDTVRQLAVRMKERGIKPELEIFDLGMANYLKVLRREGLVDGTAYVNLLLGNIAGAQATPLEFAALRAAIDQDVLVCVAGIGRHQLNSNLLGLLFADGARIGLEDNLWYDTERTSLATNDQLVARLLRIANELGRKLMPPEALRKVLGLN